MASRPPLGNPRHQVAAPHAPRPRDGRRVQTLRASAGPPDLAEVAREAVISFLHDASAATAGREASRRTGSEPEAPADGDVRTADRNRAAPAEAMTGTAPSATDQFAVQSVALRAAAISVATLDRIEAAAAKVEADIAAALEAHAELQAGAGAAAEAAVSAAQAAWEAAGSAAESDRSAGAKLRVVARYAAVTAVLVVAELILFVLFATSAH